MEPPGPEPKRRPRRLWIGGGIVGFLILLAVIAAVTLRDDGEDGGGPGQVAQTSGSQPDATLTFDTLKEQAIRVSYDDLFRSFGAYDGQTLYYRGEVVTVNAVDGEDLGQEPGLPFYSSEVRVTLTFPGNWVGNVVITYEPPAARDGDFVEFVAKYQGLESFTMPDGSIATMPHLVEARVKVLETASTP